MTSEKLTFTRKTSLSRRMPGNKINILHNRYIDIVGIGIRLCFHPNIKLKICLDRVRIIV